MNYTRRAVKPARAEVLDSDGHFQQKFLTPNRVAFLRRLAEGPVNGIAPGWHVAQFVIRGNLAVWSNSRKGQVSLTDLGRQVLAEYDTLKPTPDAVEVEDNAA